jgi:quercetin dioxygenase-like cupin family protein
MQEGHVNLGRRIVVATVLLCLVGLGWAHGGDLPAVQATPDQFTWVRDPRGYEQANIVGDPARPGLYTAHIRFSPGQRITPHFHPDDRIVTVLAGTVLFAYGEQFDEAVLRKLPAGSVWTEPAGQSHFAWARDGEVLLQVIGFGPSATTPIPPRP